MPDETQTTPPPETPTVVDAVPSEPVAVETALTEPAIAEVSVAAGVAPSEPQLAEVTASLALETAPTSDPQSGQSVRIDPITPEVLSQPQAVEVSVEPTSFVIQSVKSPSLQKSANELLAKGNPSIEVRKQKKIERIMGLFVHKTTITNNDVEKFLHVSDSTATRYLATLEKEGKIKQGNKKGSAVSYSKI